MSEPSVGDLLERIEGLERALASRPPATPRLRRRARRLTVLAVALVSIALPASILANHIFADVPTGHTFHADIEAIYNAGVTTTGCGGGNYCPDELVTRGQMAGFLNRLGALGPGKVPVANATKLDGLDSGQFARSDVVATGYYQCNARDMRPTTPDVAWNTTDANRLLFLTAGSGTFSCGVHLPDGATITELALDAYDSEETAEVVCRLEYWQFGLGLNQPHLALVQTGLDFISGEVTVTDTTIDSSTVDTQQNAYATECTIFGTGENVGIFGIRVAYEISGLPVE